MIKSRPFGGATITGEDAKTFQAMLADDLRAINREVAEASAKIGRKPMHPKAQSARNRASELSENVGTHETHVGTHEK